MTKQPPTAPLKVKVLAPAEAEKLRAKYHVTPEAMRQAIKARNLDELEAAARNGWPGAAEALAKLKAEA